MRIANNISALNTHRTLVNSDSAMSKSMERLSSGYRINKAADDAAGLAISEKMRAQVKGLNQASRNAQDGISMIQTAEGGLNEMHSILQRMRELAVQAGNDTLTASDKDEIQKEITQLVSEVDRISSDTEFNTKKLLNGEAGIASSAQNGVVGNTVTLGTTTLNAGNIDANLDSAVTVRASSDTSTGVYQVVIDKTATAARLSGAATFGTGANTRISTANAGQLTVNGITIDIAGGDGTTTGDTLATVISKINNVTNQSGVVASASAGGTELVLSTEEKGSSVTISIQGSNNLLKDLGLTTGTETALTDAGEDAVGTINGTAATGVGNTLTLDKDGDAADGLSIELSDDLAITDATTADSLTFDAAVDPNGQVVLQIGANSNQTIL